MLQDLRQRLQAAGLDTDAINVIVRVTKRTDVPSNLANQWAAYWDGRVLHDLVSLDHTNRQHVLDREVDNFLQDPLHQIARIAHSVNQVQDADLRLVGELAVALDDVRTAFGRDVTVPTVSRFTQKLRYSTLTDIDVATTKAIIEVSTQHTASGKVAQLAVLRSVEANLLGLPVFHLLPNVNQNSASATALTAAGSAGVYNGIAALAASIRGLP